MFSLLNYLQRTWAGVFFFTLFIWFAFHLWQGDRGYYSFKQSQVERTVKEQEYAELKIKREKLENNVRHLRSTSLDPDLLDERTRIMLNRMESNEYILPVN